MKSFWCQEWIVKKQVPDQVKQDIEEPVGKNPLLLRECAKEYPHHEDVYDRLAPRRGIALHRGGMEELQAMHRSA